MRYGILIILFAYLGLALFLSKLNIVSILWFSAPAIIPIIIEILYLNGKVQSRAIPITGIVILTLAVPVYISDYIYKGVDAQAGLGTAIMPIYQLIILFVASVIVGISRFFNKKSGTVAP